MSDTAASVERTSFSANEPVIVGHVVLWLLANLGTFVVAHSNHLLSASVWASFSTGWAPYITAAVLTFSAFILRKKVSPAWKKFTDVAAKNGIPVPDEQQLELLADKILLAIEAKQTPVVNTVNLSNGTASAGNDGVVDPSWNPPVNVTA